MMKRAIIAAAIAAAFAAFDSSADNVGGATHLVEAHAEDSKVIVFLPVDEILSPQDATNYLLWAEATYPGKRVKAVWETDSVALPVSDPSVLPLLRKGDKVVDQTGRPRFVVAEVDGGKVSLRLDKDALPEKGDMTPELCLATAWILSRDALFARWDGLLSSSVPTNAAMARREIGLLEKSAVLSRKGQAGESWRAGFKDFKERNPNCQARVEFRNDTGTGVVVRVNGEKRIIEPGESWSLSPNAPMKSGIIRWEARGCGSEQHWDNLDEDWDWGEGSVSWSPSGEDAVVTIKSGDMGKAKRLPVVALPKDAVAYDGANETISVRITYLDPGQKAESSGRVELKYRKDLNAWAANFRPRRMLTRCDVSLDGWESASYAPSEVRPLSRGEVVYLKGAPAKKRKMPWGKLHVHVERNGQAGKLPFFVGKVLMTLPDNQNATTVSPEELGLPAKAEESVKLNVKLQLDEGFRPAETNVVLRRGKDCDVWLSILKPAPPWPQENEVLTNWLKYRVLKVQKEEETNNAETEKYRLLGFRPSGSPVERGEEFEKKVDRMVAHIRECRGCKHHAAPTSSARMEALAILGWDRENQKSFLSWPQNIIVKGTIHGKLQSWWKNCELVLSKDWDDFAKLREARKLWNGEVASGNTEFAKAFVHFENCGEPECEYCRPLADKMREAGTDFRARRKMFFRALMLNPEIDWGLVSKPDDRKVEAMLGLFEKSSVKTGGKP